MTCCGCARFVPLVNETGRCLRCWAIELVAGAVARLADRAAERLGIEARREELRRLDRRERA